MRIRAVICDVYRTLLEVGLPPSDAESQWNILVRKVFGADVQCPSLADFFQAADRVISREHEIAKARGIAYPEVFWPAICREVFAPLSTLEPAAQDEFLYLQMQLVRRLRAMPGAVATLRALAQRKVAIGIASNAQPYTLRELQEHIDTMGPCGPFDADLCFFSFQAGFSKPNPHVFQWLQSRLQARGILPSETLMVGDRWDNDFFPARTYGWEVWMISDHPCDAPHRNGTWADLLATVSGL